VDGRKAGWADGNTTIFFLLFFLFSLFTNGGLFNCFVMGGAASGLADDNDSIKMNEGNKSRTLWWPMLM